MNAIDLYRLSSWFYRHHMRLFSKAICGIVFLLFNSYIPPTCIIGENTKCGYKGIGVVIHSRAVVGDNCIIGQGVTIGGRNKFYDVPVIGNNVIMSTGAKLLGPIKIGDNVVIGANAVLVCDAPSNTVWAGVPAKLLKENINIGDYS